MSLKNIPISKYSKIKVGITMGDPAGIGPEIIAKALPRIHRLARIVIIGDRWVFEQRTENREQRTENGFVDLKNVVRKNFQFGKVRAEYGRASIQYLDKALELIKNKKIDCLVTCPISKEAINLAGWRYSGHTEYLAKVTAARNAQMMLLNQDLRFVLATRHIAIKEVPRKLNKLDRTILLAYQALKDFFAIRNPRLVVCGLNPHASDNGIIGDEENKIIKPIINKLRRKIKYLDGPLSADVAIAKAKNHSYDCVIAMYHDQALIPLKLFGNDGGINLTLGLPFVRTSPLHGTAFDIAAANVANPNPLIAAIKLALKCAGNLKKD